MYMPHGYVGFREAIDMVAPHELDFFPTVERLIRALASEALAAFGVVVGAVDPTDDPRELGEILPIRPGIWRLPRTQDAAASVGLNLRVQQDGLVLVAIFQDAALLEWHNEDQKAVSPEMTGVPILTPPPKIPNGRHRIQPGYVPFHEIPNVALAWASSGVIDPQLLPIFDPPTSDSITDALAAGSLPALGINEQTGAIILLPTSIWRAGSDDTPQSIWVLRGDRGLVPNEGESFLPIVTEADLARALNATKIPPDPVELPEGWKPAGAIESTRAAHDRVAALPNRSPAPSRLSASGRPPKIDWDVFWIEVVLYAAKHDLDQDHRAELQRHMVDWAARNWADPPDDATIRARLRKLFDAHART